MAVSVNADSYPYERVQSGYTRLRGTEEIPIKILKYLMDLPLPGYMPKDDNDHARVRLMKYLWYDGANPLANPLPTPQEKLSMLFDGDNPVLNAAGIKFLRLQCISITKACSSLDDKWTKRSRSFCICHSSSPNRILAAVSASVRGIAAPICS